MNIEEIVWEGVDWINVAQDWDKWSILVHMVLNMPCHENVRSFLSS